MKIDVLCNDGSPLGVTMKTVYGRDGRVGVGGAELALLTMCEEWSKRGDDVRLYNDPREFGASPFEQLPVQDFHEKDNRDVLIIFRSPNKRSTDANGLKVWWSCDQYTVGSFARFAPTVQKIVTISPFHAMHFKKTYDIHNSITIDLPVRVGDYERKVEKVPGRCLFSSVPDRGLQILWFIWPLIKRDVPEASLVITSDYRLWGNPSPGNDVHRSQFSQYEGITFLGAVDRDRLVTEQLKAQVHPYTCVYDELFCIAVAESQVAGCYPVTTAQGAVETTNMGSVLPGKVGDPKWVDAFHQRVVSLLTSPDLSEQQESLRKAALDRFSPQTILKQWDEKIFKEG